MPRRVSPLDDWLTRLETFSPHEIELGLSRVRAVLERLELSKPKRLLHVAGTNGKGSTVELARALLAETGEKIGTYTSPHVVRFNERICIDGIEVPDADIVAAFERVEAVRGDTALTYFEYGTLAAGVIFDTHGVDTVILEVGMGGRLDAVNAFEPDAGVITNVSLDHCDWLGRDIETIAREKAGIMRKGSPVIFGSSTVPAAVLRHADETDADLRLAGRDFDWTIGEESWDWRGRDVELRGLAPPSLKGDIQVSNAAGVLALIEAMGLADLLQRECVDRAFTSVELRGRMQVIDTDRQWILDVAHNPAAAEVLGDTLAAGDQEARTVAIIAALDDKDVAGIVAALEPVVDHWVAVAADNPRAIPVDELARQVANAANRACLEAGTLADAFDFARSVTDANDRVLVTGSFYIVGPALEALRYNRRGMGGS